MRILMKRFHWSTIVLAILITSCGQAGSPTVEPLTASHTPFSEPSDTPKPTDTPQPTNTPRPTNTPLPTATNTPIPEPIIISGSGDDVVDIDKWSGPAILIINYQGRSNFVISNYGAGGEKIDLLVNTIGSY